MSVKCNYSDKYYPLLETWKLHPETFESNVREFFANAEEILNGSVVQNNTPLRSIEVKETSFNPGLEVSKDVQSVDQFYINAPSKYRQMSNSFMRCMVESAIYDPKTETLINANQLIGDVSYLNQAILDYKTLLLSIIANYLNSNGISYNGSPNDLEAIQDFVLQNYIPSIENTEVYNTYVIITNFDKLLSLHAPFIQVAPEYAKSSQYHPKRYTYIGAEVKHYTGVMSTDEFMSAENNTSDIVKILLQYFQEVDENNHPIEGTSINLGGFNSAMSKVFAWAQTNEAARAILAEDSNADFGKIIGMYLDSVKGKKVKDAHITYLTNKLRGIKHFIYGNKIPDELKIVFTHLVEKTVPSSYIQYDIVGTDATVKYLTERSILLQRTFLNECVDTAAEYWKVNKTLYDTLLKDKGYTIKVQQTASNTYVVNINNQTITISGGQYGSIQLSGEIENIVDIVEDIAQLFISEDTLRVGEQLYGTTNLTKLYAPVIASIIVKSQLESASDFKTPFGPMQELARVLSIMHGADVINVVKNGEGNNLPLYQMLCLSYRHHDIHKRLEEDRQNRDIQTPYFYNIAYNNINHIRAPQIRAGVLAKDGTYKTAASLSADEVMHLAILHDFYDNLTTEYTLDENSRQRSGIVGFQSHVYSDKNKHFIQMFDLSAEWLVGYDDAGHKITINPAGLIKAYLNRDHDDLELLVQAFYYSGKNQIDTIIENLLNDYRAVFPDREIKDLKDVEKIISNYEGKIDELRQKFIANGINFVEEIHISKSGVNETLYYLQRQFATLESTRAFLNSQFKQFNEDVKGARKTIKKALDSRKKAPDINRLLHAYFLADVLFTNDYNRMMVGQVFAHTHKNKRKVSDIQMELGWSSSMSEERRAQIEKQAKDIWESENYAARWISQVKRMVIYGATYHSYAQGLKYGVPEFIKTAVFEDIPSNVFSITGDSDKVDSMDGSGWTSPIFSRLQNYSLLDAAVGANKKTIYHDIESKYGVPTLLKWAEYEITNEKRRNSYTTSLENLYRRMHNLQFDSSISFEYVPENLYYTDNKGNYYEIDAIEVKNGIGYILRTRVQPNGKRIEVVEPIQIQVNTIYDIDQLLGGAWAMSKEDDRLVFTESNMDILTKIVCDNNLKDYMIGWAVNKSGMKVGVTNLNTVDIWTNDTELRYVTLSTRFGGLQMNADHELDHAEVTEMTQMISALEQMGVMHDRVVEIYREIGKFCYDSIADIAAAAYSDTDKDKLYQIYGRAIIEAFNSGNKDTLGLAQSFISIAQRSIQDNKITYQIPFSSASINGIFNSTVTSQLIKKSIRRHYSGVAAVLNPSFNVIEYYTVNGLQYRKEELYDIIKEALDARNLGYLLDKYSVDDFISNWEFILNAPNVTNGTILSNPFVHEITHQMQNLDGTVWYSNDQIDFEDTVVIINEVYDENGNVIDTTLSAPIKIDTFEKYDMVKHDPRRKLIHTLRPRNLKGANTTFTINGETKSIFESPYTIALKYFNSSSATDAKTFESELETIFTKEYTKIFDVTDGYVSVLAKNHMVIMNYLMEAFKAKTGLDGYTHPNMFKHYLIQQQQLLLNAIADGNPFDWFGETVTATDVKVHGAQIGMGKLFAKQFGLRKGDSLSQIKKEGSAFFYHRIKENFAISNNDPETYDCVLYDGQGTKLHVKILPKAEWAKFKTDTPLYRNEEYITVDGIIYHNGEELFAGEGKEIHTYVDSQNNESDLILIDNIDRLQELINDGDYIYTEYNYTSNNHKELIKFKYKGDDFRVVVGINPNTGKTQWRTITNAELNTINPEELIDILTIHETKSLHHRIGTWAEEKYENFLKSLNFVGTRIPCQNMTSFAPMEVVMFSDVEANEIYLPTTITWLEGSDYDIDKTYLLGFSVANNGKIHTEGKSKRYQGDRLRNTVVNGIMDIIKNPRTQINLTNPLSMEHMQDLSSKSILGKAARRMTSFNPACKYMMQIENMVGKGVIGNVATAIKSFFALSTVYNEAYSNIYKELINGNFKAVRSLLNKYSFKQNDKYRTLANVNMELFMNINWDIIPEDIKIPLLEIIEWQAGLSDQSLILGELLNSATDEKAVQKIIK